MSDRVARTTRRAGIGGAEAIPGDRQGLGVRERVQGGIQQRRMQTEAAAVDIATEHSPAHSARTARWIAVSDDEQAVSTVTAGPL
jgi:hypothetical protein